jgi:hypothetical protein
VTRRARNVEGDDRFKGGGLRSLSWGVALSGKDPSPRRAAACATHARGERTLDGKQSSPEERDTDLVVGLGGHLAHQLGAHVHELVLELDGFCDRDTVLGDLRRTVRLVDHSVTAFGAKRHLNEGPASITRPLKIMLDPTIPSEASLATI